MSRSLERQRPAAPKGKRGLVMLQAALFTPAAILMFAGVVLAIVKVASGDTGYLVMLFVTGFLAFILGFQAYHYVRDLAAEPVHSEGEISKKWTKGNLFFFFVPGYYIAVKGSIYTVSRHAYRGLLEEDMVRIRHYPYTLTVELVERFDETEKKFVPAGPDGSLY